MHHEPANIIETDNAASYKTKLGVILFIVYSFIYSGFVFIGLFIPELMGEKLILGLNIAVIYGIGLIVLAIIMGFIYNFFCTRKENQLNKN